MERYHAVSHLQFIEDHLILQIDGQEYRFDLKTISSRLWQASHAEREIYEISPSGYGIHWPLIDEDLSIDGLLGIEHKSEVLVDRGTS